jgi:hypothetical protein
MVGETTLREGRLEVFAPDMLLRCSSLFLLARFNLASLSQYCETLSVLPSVAYRWHESG